MSVEYHCCYSPSPVSTPELNLFLFPAAAAVSQAEAPWARWASPRCLPPQSPRTLPSPHPKLWDTETPGTTTARPARAQTQTICCRLRPALLPRLTGGRGWTQSRTTSLEVPDFTEEKCKVILEVLRLIIIKNWERSLINFLKVQSVADRK